jgi:hypothetical protein
VEGVFEELALVVWVPLAYWFYFNEYQRLFWGVTESEINPSALEGVFWKNYLGIIDWPGKCIEDTAHNPLGNCRLIGKKIGSYALSNVVNMGL